MSQYANLVTRNGLTWLLLGQILAILPLSFYLPWWMLVLWLGCAVWRIQIYRMKLGYPPAIVKVVIVVVIAVGIYLSRGTILGLDGGVVMLVAAFSLKLIELKTKRDALVILNIGFLVVVAAYLYHNGFSWVAYSLLPIIVLLAALIGLNQTRSANNPLVTLRLACVLLVQAIPLMLVLFLFFPRLEPFWTLPMPKGDQQKTGISNRMTPGEIASLTQSSELVFRAAFEGAIPPRKKLYWRALTLETYDGKTWSQAWDVAYNGRRRGPDWGYNPAVNDSVSYNIILQPHLQHWLVALEVPQSLPQGVVRFADFHLERPKPIDTIYAYQLTSWPNALREPNGLRRINIDKQLPPNSDPRAKAFAEQLKNKYSGDTEQIVNALLKYFHDEPYHYTLKTPDLGSNSVDAFMFDTKRGFCEHYASATAFILRAADIPARVVLGYQGGEINTSGNFVQVRQFDAHAWVEYWQQGRGWVTIDPTFQVAPSRIELGLNAALNSEEQDQLGNKSILGYGTDSLLTRLRMSWDNFNNNWDIFIGSYNTDEQRGLLQKLIGTSKLIYLGMFLVIGMVIISAIWLLLLLKPWKKDKDPFLRYYHQFEQLLASQGVSRELGEGPVAFAKRAEKELPDYAQLIKQFSEVFVAERYAEQQRDCSLAVLLKRLRKALPWRRRLLGK